MEYSVKHRMFPGKKILSLLSGDLKNVGRDPLLLLASLAPVLMVIVFRILIPLFSGLLREYLDFDLTPHYPFIISVAVLLPPMLFGTVIGFFLVDERDENILSYFAVTPLGKTGYMIYRLAVSCVAGFLSVFLLSWGAGLVSYPILPLIPVAFLAAVEAPLIVLFLGAFASNKVEALTLSKATGFFDMAPVAGYLLPSPWHFLAGLLPPYWVSKAFLAGYAGDPLYWLYFLGGLLVHGLYLFFLLSRFEKRIS